IKLIALLNLIILANSCNVFQRYVLRSDCEDDNVIDDSDPKEFLEDNSCGFFKKHILRRDCPETPQEKSKNTRECNLIERFVLNKSHCEYNPDEYLDVPEIIARHGYLSETHTVVTEDGYILSIHRIPGSRNGTKSRQPVFLQHGLLGSSADWIVNGNLSLAYYLADRGYDVWLGNARGNDYSRAHTYLPTNSAEFWNFSFHEMGTRDLPTVLYHISNTTDRYGDIIYIGHSMGTTMFFIFASEDPQAAKNVKVMSALAPTAYMTHMHAPVRYFAPYANDIQWLSKYLGFKRFLPNNKILKTLSYQCELFKVSKEICENLIFAICGFNKDEFNSDILPVLLSKDPAGASTKTILHYLQEIKNDGLFQKFDYGSKGNLIEYGVKFPPRYNISKIDRPIHLMYAMNDWLTNYTDVIRLGGELKNLKGLYKVAMESFNHVDFIFGKDVIELVYDPLYKFLLPYSTN
ncbi:unnamed protein product, partial [Phyllotreta striolata]